MHVEVNETNIALYELTKLTGNSKEELLKSAKEAEQSGYTLYCRVPEPDEPLEQNVFHAFGSEPAPKVDIGEELLRDIFMDPTQQHSTEFNIIDVVQGEVVENEEGK